MGEIWQSVVTTLSPGWVGDLAQVLGMIFVAFTLRQSVRTQEVDAFLRLHDRWDRISDLYRQEYRELPVEKKQPWVMMLFSFGEHLACLSNGGWLKHWRLCQYFSNTVELVEQWLARDEYSKERLDPLFMPEFKEMLRRQRNQAK